ncbi:MAG: hypothetical protein QGG90_09060 [Nitrospinota bacterium]|nr:hypothetical protein [Nitrospinota bacterium]
MLALREIAADRVRFDKDLKEIMQTSPQELKRIYGDPAKRDMPPPPTGRSFL